MLGYTDSQNELRIFEATSTNDMKQKCFLEHKYTRCKDLQFSFDDYRKINSLNESLFYLNPKMKEMGLPQNSS